LIDVKEPLHGPLGRPAPDIAEATAQEIGTTRPVSIALGELGDLPVRSYGRLFHLPQVQFAKIGLAGVGHSARWWQAWEDAWRALPPRIGRVGVVYVDWQEAGAPRPESALRAFASSACSVVLFDTFTKDGRSLLDCASREKLAEWIAQARGVAPTLVLAGSLTPHALAGLREYEPDYVAIRGAACPEGRLGTICGVKLRHFAAALRDAFDTEDKLGTAVPRRLEP